MKLFVISFVLLATLSCVFCEEYDHVIDLTFDGTPCESETISITFTAFYSVHTVILHYNPSVFDATHDFSQHEDKICPYLGPHASAVFVGGVLHKLYLDETTSLGAAHELEQVRHFYNRAAEELENEPDHAKERRERIQSHPGLSFIVTRTDSTFRDDIYCGSDDHDHAHGHAAHLAPTKTHFETSRIELIPQLPAAGNQSNTISGLNSTSIYKIPAPSPCPTAAAPKQVSISIAADTTFTSTFGTLSAAQAEITALVQFMSATYGNTLNIKMTLASMVIRQTFDTAASGFTWNTGDCATQSSSTMLDRFTNWRLNQPNSGIWHLVNKCWASGNVGLAWVGVVCVQGAPLNGAGPQRFSNTGVSSYIRGTGHLVVTHEIGHNFGANHDDVYLGIMVSCFCGAAKTFRDFSFGSQSAMCTKTGAATCLTPASTSTTAATTTTTRAPTTTTTTTRAPTTTTTTTRAPTTTTRAPTTTTRAPTTAAATTTTRAPTTAAATTTTRAPTTTAATTTTRAPTTAATTTTVATTPGQAAQILNAVNAARAARGNPPLTWSSGAETFANQAVSSCTWPPTASATSTYSLSYFANSPQSATNPFTQVDRVLTTGRSGYTCNTDTCLSTNGLCPTFRNWMASTSTGFACVTKKCPLGSVGPWGTGVAWDFSACSQTVYAIYSGNRPGGTCPATNNKREEDPCDSICDGRNCGTAIVDGCPPLVCGSGACDPRATCEEGVCVCKSITTCESRKVTCGTIIDNCGQEIVCNSACPNTCQPLTAPEACGSRTCGSVPDGCGGYVRCGACTESEVCAPEGTCLSCSGQCHAMATCVRSDDAETAVCQCNPGFSGDGLVCTPDSAPFVTDGQCSGLSWKEFLGDADSFLTVQAVAEGGPSACSVSHSARGQSTSTLDAIVFKSYEYDVRGGDALWAVDVQRGTANGIVGLLAGAASESGDSYRFYWDSSDSTFYFQSVSKKSRNTRQKVTTASWEPSTTKTLSIIARTDGSVVVGIDGSEVKAFRITNGKGPTKSNFGLLASASTDVVFYNFLMTTAAELQLTAYGCWDANELASLIASMLNIDISQLEVTVTCDATGSSSSITIVIANADQQTRSALRAAAGPINAAALVTSLNGWLESGSVVQASVTGLSPAIEAAIPVTTVSGSSAGGLSGGEIAGIVIGSVAGAVLVAGGVAYAVTRSDNHSSSSSSSTPEARQKRQSWRASLWRSKVPDGGINIESGFEDRSSKHKSITARSPGFD